MEEVNIPQLSDKILQAYSGRDGVLKKSLIKMKIPEDKNTETAA